MKEKTTRRDFLKKSTMAAAGLSVTGVAHNSVAAPIIETKKRVIGANDKVRVGFIGVGNRGTQLLHLFMEQPDCEVAALCDVYEPYVTRDYSAVHERYKKDMGSRIPKMGENFQKAFNNSPIIGRCSKTKASMRYVSAPLIIGTRFKQSMQLTRVRTYSWKSRYLKR